MTSPAIIQVHWLDSANRCGWYEPDNCIEDDMIVKSIGYLCAETDKYIAISTSLSGVDTFCDPLTIPKFAIVGMWEVEI